MCAQGIDELLTTIDVSNTLAAIGNNSYVSQLPKFIEVLGNWNVLNNSNIVIKKSELYAQTTSQMLTNQVAGSNLRYLNYQVFPYALVA